MLSPEGASGVLRMVDVVDELKAKLVEIDGKMEELRREIVVLEAQKSAFETVIRVYDPVSHWLRRLRRHATLHPEKRGAVAQPNSSRAGTTAISCSTSWGRAFVTCPQ